MGGFTSSTSISIHANQNNNNNNNSVTAEKSFVNNSPKSINLSRSIIWVFGKFFQIWAVFHLYDFLSAHFVLKKGGANSPSPLITIDTLTKNAIAVAGATYDPNVTNLVLEKPSMSISVAGLYILAGAILGWIVVENFIRFIVQRYTNKIFFTSSMNTSYLKEQQQQQQDKIESGGNDMMNAFSSAVVTKLVLHSMWITGSVLLWAYALTVLGPSRVILLQFVEHCIAIFLGHLLGWKSSPRAMQSGHILLLIMSLLVMIVGRTDDQQQQQNLDPLSWTQRIFLIGDTISLPDLIKHAWYLLVLLGSLMFTVLRKNHSKRLSVDLRKVNFEQQTGLPGSSFWATITVAGILMTPFIFVNFIMRPGEILVELLSIVDVPRALMYGLCLITIPYYTEQMSQVSMTGGSAGNAATGIINDPTMSVVPSLFWRMILTFGIIVMFFSWQTSAISIGFLLLLKAVSDITGSQMDRSTPLPSFFPGSGANKQQFASPNTRLSNRIANGITMYLQFIMANRDSRYLFIFLVANLLFMFVELAYGIWSNSLGLISDSAHMLFDCAALGVGLYGAFMSKWKRNSTYTYGYSRYEFLSGFVNGILLVFISLYIFIEAFHRVFDPPTIDTHRLLLVSVLGFLVNLMGVIFFHEDHAHGHHHDENMHGVYLHILADALGSVGVIISTILMQYFGWFLADPLCSIMISVLILMTSYPLISNSCSVLLQRAPSHLDKDISDCIHEVEHIEGVLQVYGTHFWTLSSSVIVGSLHMRVQDHVNEQDVLKKVTEFFRNQCNVSDLTVQIEKSGAGSATHHHHHP